MKTMNDYCLEQFHEKLYKLSLDGGMTCPNRDGICGTGGCIFCSEGGSGDFAASRALPISDQIEEAKKRVSGKFKGSHYIAYFQAYTNTYASADRLRELYLPLLEREDISVISIATRPDCLGPDILEVLDELNREKPVWVELGLQTSKAESAEYIRRGYPNSAFVSAVKNLTDIGVHVITHVILGLPGETVEDMEETVRLAVACGTNGIKLQLLHVLEGTDLAEEYRKGRVSVMSQDEYVDAVCACLRLIPKNVVIHRMTGDGPKKTLIAPLWSGDKKKVINVLRKATERINQPD